MDGRTKNLPILQDFVPYCGRCRKKCLTSPHSMSVAFFQSTLNYDNKTTISLFVFPFPRIASFLPKIFSYFCHVLEWPETSPDAEMTRFRRLRRRMRLLSPALLFPPLCFYIDSYFIQATQILKCDSVCIFI